MGSRKQGGLLAAGAPSPDFELPDAAGVKHSLKQLLAEGPVLLAFFKISCPVCQFTFPFLERWHQSGKLRVFGISQNDARDTREFADEFGTTFPMLLDSAARGYVVSNAFGISSVPTLFLLEPDGRIGAVIEGFVKADLEALGRRFESSPFRANESVPAWRAG